MINGTWRIEKNAWQAPGQSGARPNLPGMWYVFVLVCLVFGASATVRMVLDEPGLITMSAGLLKITGISGLFLWTSLRLSLHQSDVSTAGPDRSLIKQRIALISLMTLLVLTTIPLLPDQQVWWLFIYPMVAAGLILPGKAAKISIGAVTLLSVVSAWLLSDGVHAVILTKVVLALGAVVIRMLTIATLELQASRDEVARLAVAEERLRFARDLHDSLGHTLSSIVLKSELGSRLIDRDPERARAEMQDVEHVGRGALRDLRAVVTSYRTPTMASELQSAGELLRSAGISLKVEQARDEVPAEIEPVLAWGIREGTTNVVRHSKAENCVLRIIRDNGSVRLEIFDDGLCHSTDQPGNQRGSGLTGLAERAASVGGWLTAQDQPEGGFLLVLETPLSREGYKQT